MPEYLFTIDWADEEAGIASVEFRRADDGPLTEDELVLLDAVLHFTDTAINDEVTLVSNKGHEATLDLNPGDPNDN